MEPMETAVVSVAGKLRDDEVLLWFDAVLTAHRESEEDWSRTLPRLADLVAERALPAEALQAFTEHMATVTSPATVLSEMDRKGDELPRLYWELLAGAQTTTAAPAPQAWDSTAAPRWYAHLTQVLGNGWPGWSGKEEEWDRFKAFFLGYAEQAGVRLQAQLLLDSVEQTPDKVAGFAAHGIAIATHAQAVARTKAADLWSQYEPKAWYATLTQGWGGWTGQDADWDKFTQYFLWYAKNQNVGEGAAAFLGRVEASGDKRAAFAEHGIPLPDAPVAAPVGELAEKVAERDKRVEAELAELSRASEVFDRIALDIVENSDPAELESATEEEIQELWERSVLAKIQAYVETAPPDEVAKLRAAEGVSDQVKALLPQS
ncbi:hypothetical protein M8542_33820 [Amycolatopsis sp. OK19-0408]|uniref:Uncharacterized protein n=1 Tax=Amycolatopsis iheyensis TaxID=2945988 RepID=A0A9X2NFE3_9PSEU|nr:hypothetical protein [Amycolatopsis iheyensis]MCR6487816.1 hypothetical protein [Amycolatopsis iheyensis]